MSLLLLALTQLDIKCQHSPVLIKAQQFDWLQALCRALRLASKLTADTHLTENVCAYHNFWSVLFLSAVLQLVIPLYLLIYS